MNRPLLFGSLSLTSCHSFPYTFPCSNKMCRSQHWALLLFLPWPWIPSPSIFTPCLFAWLTHTEPSRFSSGLARKLLVKYSSSVFPLPLFHIELILSAYLFLLVCGPPQNKNHFTSARKWPINWTCGVQSINYTEVLIIPPGSWETSAKY